MVVPENVWEPPTSPILGESCSHFLIKFSLPFCDMYKVVSISLAIYGIQVGTDWRAESQLDSTYRVELVCVVIVQCTGLLWSNIFIVVPCTYCAQVCTGCFIKSLQAYWTEVFTNVERHNEKRALNLSHKPKPIVPPCPHKHCRLLQPLLWLQNSQDAKPSVPSVENKRPQCPQDSAFGREVSKQCSVSRAGSSPLLRPDPG